MIAYDFNNNEMQTITKQIYSYLNITDFLNENLALKINKIALNQIILNICRNEQ